MKLRRWTIIRRNDDGTWSPTPRKFWLYRNARKAQRFHNSFGLPGTMGGQLEQVFYGPRFVVWDRGVALPDAGRKSGGFINPAKVPMA